MKFLEETKNVFKKTGLHFRTGVSYMLPVLLIGGFLGSLAILGQGSDAGIWKVFKEIGSIGMTYFVPVMAAYVAFSIADNAGIAPGLIIGVLAQRTDSGYLGALLGGILVGYITYMLMQIEVKEIFQTTWGMLVPVISTLVTGLFLVLVIGPPIAALMEALGTFLNTLDKNGGAIMGAVMGGLGGLDYGGPFSKTQSTFATAVMEMKLFTPLGICGAIVTVPPLGMCLATLMAPRLYTRKERTYAKQSWLYALVAGFTEIAIPLAVGDIVRVTVATVFGCVVTGVISGIFALELYTPVLGIPQWFFYNKIIIYIISLLAGILTVALTANFLKKISSRDIEALDREDEEIQ